MAVQASDNAVSRSGFARGSIGLHRHTPATHSAGTARKRQSDRLQRHRHGHRAARRRATARRAARRRRDQDRRRRSGSDPVDGLPDRGRGCNRQPAFLRRDRGHAIERIPFARQHPLVLARGTPRRERRGDPVAGTQIVVREQRLGFSLKFTRKRVVVMSGRGERGPMLDLLQGIRVISFNHFLLGPMGIQALADLGADVIAVESPEGAWQRHWSSGDIWQDGQGMVHVCTNRNKRSVALDLKAPQGREIALKLIDGADVVAENFRPGVMDKLGFGYGALRRRKPSLIYASASGYGPDGPYAERPGQDLLAQALFGLMAITGQNAGGPRPVGVSAIDHHGAAVFAMGILAALLRRERTGQGCRVDASLMQAALDLQVESLTAWLK